MKPGSALALLVAAHGVAAAAPAPPAAMASVEVVGVAPLAGLGIERRLLPYAVQAADGDTMGGAHGDNLADYMARNLNGVNVNDISGSPFQVDLTYRGFRASPVLGTSQGISVYLDGVRINEPFGDVVNWDMVPEAAIGTLLLVPGSNPLYGLNTLGGALALSGKSGVSHPGTELGLSAGGSGRKRFDLAHGFTGTGGWHGFAATTIFDERGWRDHSQGRLGNMYARGGRTGAATDWSVTFIGGSSRLRGNGLLPDAMAQEDVRAAYSYPDVTRNRLLQLQASLVHRFGPRTELSATAYTRSSRRNTVNGDVELDDGALAGAFNTTATRQRGQGASALVSMRRRQQRIDVGATVDRTAVRFGQFGQQGSLSDQREVLPQAGAEPEPGSSVIGSSRIVGAFISDTWSVDPAIHITASARWNHAQVNNTLSSALGLQPAESFTYTKLNPALGIAHDVGGGVTIGASFAQGNRVPTVIELGCADPQQPCQLPVALQSDPYLRQVVSRTVETGARYRHDGVSASVSLYRTVNRDDILFLSSGLTRLGFFANFARTRHQGADVAASTATGGWTLRASYSYLDAVYDAPGVLFTGVRTVRIARGTPLAGLPRHTLKASADWQAPAGFTLGAEVQALSSLPTQGNEDGLAADSLPGSAPQTMDLRVRGHAVMSARVEWVPAAGWEVYARVANLFDRRYASFGAVARDVFSESGREGQNSRFVAPGAPRSVSFRVRYRY